MNLTRTLFITALGKTACDQQEVAVGEQHENRKDVRADLSGLFDGFTSAARSDSALIDRLLPKGDKDISAPMLKAASDSYIQAVKLAFLSELEKIGYRDTMPAAPNAVGMSPGAASYVSPTKRVAADLAAKTPARFGSAAKPAAGVGQKLLGLFR